MAVYQGARRRPAFGPFGLPLGPRPSSRVDRPASRPTSGPSARAHGRRNGRSRVGIARPTTQRVGVGLAGIVLAFGAAFLWLTQSVQITTTNYDIARLSAERDRLQGLGADLQADLDRLSGAPAVRQQAFADGLGQLGAPIIIPAR